MAELELERFIRARYPILYLVSWEESRVEELLIGLGRRLGKNVFTWSITRGIAPAGASVQSKRVLNASTADPVGGLKEVLERMDPSLYLFKDFHPYLRSPEVIRLLRDLASHLRKSPKTLILLSPRLELPVELEKTVTVVDFPLPAFVELQAFVSTLASELGEKGRFEVRLEGEARERLVRGLAGLTLEEAENVLAKSVIEHGSLDGAALPGVLEEKKQIIRKSGVLEFQESAESLERVGGLESLKAWFRQRRDATSERARQFGLPAPKGILLLGVQGCGKSLCAKAVASAWQQPLLRLDVSRIFSSLVGSSESNVRQAIKIAESVAPAILWVDEIDKAFAGVQSSAFSDAGTTARVFGGFITWLQEKTAPVFVIATANNVASLPAELLRKGRFDEIFFVDLPGARDRAEILSVHLIGRRRDARAFDLDRLAALSEGYSGAELEQAVVAGLYAAFAAGRELSTDDVARAIQETVPLSKTMSEQIDGMRAWAKGRARPAV